MKLMISKFGAFLGLCIFSLAAQAGDMSECAKMPDPDKKNFCLGSYAGSATYCDKIKNGELRRECMFKVVKVQREVTYKPAKPKAAEE
jgi:hypothetical protein